MAQPNKKINIPKQLLEQLYLEEQLTTKQISLRLKEYDIIASPTSVRNYLDKYNIKKRTRSECTALQIRNLKDTNLEYYMESRKKAGKKISETMHKKGFNALSIASKKARASYFANRTEEQRLRDLELQRKRGEKGRQNRRISGGYGKGSSQKEDELYNDLKRYFKKYDIKRHYTDHRYSREFDGYKYNCDFYIPELDLFIEYNGFFTHGPEPFDKSSPEHQAILKRYQDKNISMRVWTDKDVRKVNVARKRLLNLLVIYYDNKMYLTTNGKTTPLSSLANLENIIGIS